MNATLFLVSTLFNLYLMVIMLRLWLQFARADFYNPFSQFVVKATQPVVGPLRRFIPAIGRLDTATLVFAFVVVMLKFVTITLLFGNGTFDIAALLVMSFASLIDQFLSLMFFVLIVRAIMSFVSQGGNPIEMLFQQLTEPFLAPIRRFIPPMGGFDLSVLVAIIVIQFATILLTDVFGKLP
jgi:YggT family protein